MRQEKSILESLFHALSNINPIVVNESLSSIDLLAKGGIDMFGAILGWFKGGLLTILMDS
jgi:hypothetical protein